MKILTSSSIIMRLTDFGEADLIVSFLTENSGRIKGIAKAARRSKKRFANCLDLFCMSKLEYEVKKKGELHFLHSGKLINAFPGIRSDYSRLSLASYMVELTETIFPIEVPDEHIFYLLNNSLAALDNGKRTDLTRLFFESRCMTLGGFMINFEACCDCARKYTGEGKAIFNREKGGISCLHCRHESSISPALFPDEIKELIKIQSIKNTKNELYSVTESMLDKLKLIMKLHINYRIGNDFKSLKYLD